AEGGPPIVDFPPGGLEAEVKAYVDSVEDDLRVRKSIIEQIKDKTGTDDELQCVLRYTCNGWPEHLKSIAVKASADFKESGSLSETNGLVLRGKQIVIPKSMKGDMLLKIHQGHQGLTKCREHYRGAVWWPGIASDVKKLVSSCKHCNIHRPSQNREPLLTTPLPDLPWQKFAADLCEHKGHHYLIELMTDNGPQFTDEQFKHFAAEYDFQHVTSSPHFPQSNGMAKRAVRTAKWILKQDDPHQALLSYHSTPTEPTRESLARLLMGREICTTLPVLKESLRPMWPNLEAVKTTNAKAKQCYEKYYNRKYSTKPLPPLIIGDKVRLKIDGEKAWTTTATVQHQEAMPRSFTLETERGDTPRRNWCHIQLVGQELSPPSKIDSSQPTDQQGQSGSSEQDLEQSKSDIPCSPKPLGQVITRFGRAVKPNPKYAS
ncbi:hypothetical protein QTP70_034683, partial [Hemibagrus guttatus]